MTTLIVVCGLLSLTSFIAGAVMVADDEYRYASFCFALGIWIMWIGLMLK